MRGFRAVIGMFSCLWVACLSDLKPDVGELALPAQEPGDTGGEEGGAVANGGSSSNGGGNGSPEADGGKDEGRDAAAGSTAGEKDAGDDTPVGGCKVKDSDPAKEVSFMRQVRPILTGCRCHDPENEDPFAILESGLTIADYKTLRKGGDMARANVIVDGNACDSIILQKLSETPPFGDRMPRDGPYLSIEERTLISDWIVEGARDN